jgi:hypothetical protein
MTAMAQIARTEADKATDAARTAGDKAAEVTREAAGQAGNVARSGFQSVRQAVDAAAEVERKTARCAGDGMAEINRTLVDLLAEQTRHNVQVFQALAQPANWGEAAQLQSEFLRTSLQRAARFTRRYFEVGQAVMTSALSTARGQAKRA